MNQDVDVYDFLEHFGVKGMQWGVRRSQAKQKKYEAKLSAAKAKQRYLNETKDSRAAARERNKKIVTGVGIATAIAVGAVATSKLLKAGKRQKVIHAARRNLQNRKKFETLLDGRRDIQIKALNDAFNAGRIDQSQGRRLATLMDRQLESKLNKKYPSR